MPQMSLLLLIILCLSAVASAETITSVKCMPLSKDELPRIDGLKRGHSTCTQLEKRIAGANAGSTFDAFTVALCYAQGRVEKQDPKAALTYFKMVLACNDPLAANAAKELGSLMHTGHTSKEDGGIDFQSKFHSELINLEDSLSFYRNAEKLGAQFLEDRIEDVSSLLANPNCKPPATPPIACPQELEDVESEVRSGKREPKDAQQCMCRASGTYLGSSERICIISLLAKLQKKDIGKATPDFCDCSPSYATSLFALCGDRADSRQKAEEDSEVSKINKNWDALTKERFLKLQMANADSELTLKELRAEHYRAGGWGSTSALYESARERAGRFQATMKVIGEEETVFKETGDLQKEDKHLNDAYKKCLSELKKLGTEYQATIDALRGSQRAWIKFRDAFADFSEQLHKDHVKKEIARDRIAQFLTRRRAHEIETECSEPPAP